MDHHLRVMAEAAARLLLRVYHEEHPDWTDDKTPLDELANWLGWHIETFHPNDYKQGTYGFVDADTDENLIWLCRDLPDTSRRFTLAHELGHAILHCHAARHLPALSSQFAALASFQNTSEQSCADLCHDTDVQENITKLFDEEQFQEILGLGQTYDPRSQRELAANIFAAELLIPLERLRVLYLVEHVSPRTLADIFAVSNAAMLNRLAGMLQERGYSQEIPLQIPQSSKRPSPKKLYDEFQQTAIEAPTPALIVAGPGSGKTSTLIGRVEYTISTLKVPPQNILALTFSRKAAQEMEERLQDVLAGTNYSLPKVSTFHAFCADLLRQHGHLVGLHTDFSLIDEAEGYFMLCQQANTIRLRHYQKLQSPAYYFPDILKAISRAKDELVSPEEYARLARRMQAQAQDDAARQQAEKALEVAHIYAIYQQELLRRGDTDFGGLLTLTLQLFHDHPHILHEQQQQYRHMLVDEFQDVNRASGVLLRELAGTEQRVWVVGDANQAIYGFRGASPANINQFETDFPGAVMLPLSRNYRSRPHLVMLAESFRCTQLESGQQPGKNQPARPTQSDPSITLAQASDDTSELAGMLQNIRSQHAKGYAYKDMVVLCRTRAHAQKISRALASEGLPVIERGGMLEQEHIKDVLSIVLLLTNTSGMGLLRVSQQREHALTQSDIEAFLLAAREQKTSPGTLLLTGEAPLTMSIQGHHTINRLSEILQTLQHANDIWSLLAQYLLVETSLVCDLLSNLDNKQNRTILADYNGLLQLARHYDQQQHTRWKLQGQKASEQGQQTLPLPLLAEQLKGFLAYLSLLVLLRQDGASRQSSEENNEEQMDILRVMTVHASKGLEFPIVYMPGLVQRRFPLQARSGPVAAPAGMLVPESMGSAAHESGESCLFYVGMTRAREHLLLSYSERYGKTKYKRSPYLDVLEAGLANAHITKLVWEPKTVGTVLSVAQSTNPKTTFSFQPSRAFIQAMKPKSLSVSAIEAYQRCPRQYAYSTIYHFESATDTYQLFWQATQKAVEALQKQMQPTDGATHLTQQEAQEIYTHHWQELEGHIAPFATMYEEHGHEVIEAIRRKFLTQEVLTWETRPRFDADVAGRIIRVTIDRVETSNQTSAPIKFVRTRFGKSKEKPSAQTRELLYMLAYRQQYPGQSVELYSHNMSTDETIPITMTTRKEQGLYDDIEQSLKKMERDEYPALPEEPFRCPTCPFFLICPV